MQVTSKPVRIELNGTNSLCGDLNLPCSPDEVVLFAHGSGSSRHSPRNQFVAKQLNATRIGTLLIDLLTADEERIDQYTGQHRFNVGLLSERLLLAIEWLKSNAETKNLSLGLFGASTGSAAAIIAAAQMPEAVAAVVSRGGRPDLAGRHLSLVKAPTLFIVGGADEPVLRMNRQAILQARTAYKLEIVQGATHLFEEPGALEAVAKLAADWFIQYQVPPGSQNRSYAWSR